MIICCQCKNQYEFKPFKSSLELPVLVCPHCGFRHTISFQPTEDKSDVSPIQLRLTAAKPVLTATRILDADRTALANDNADYTVNKSLKPNLIYVVQLDEEKGAWASTYKLQWKNTTDGGSFADLAATGEINYSATTSLTNGTAVTARSCTTAGASGSAWQNGEEVEGASTSDSINLQDEYYTEVHFAINVASALANKTYDFQVIESGGGTAIGSFASSVIIAGATTVTKTTSINGLLNKTGLTKTSSLDGLLNKVGQTKTANLDGLLNKTNLTKTSSIDSYLQKELTKTLGIDAGLGYYVNDVTITWDEFVSKTISIDALLNKLALTKTHSIDSLLNKIDLTQTSNIDSLLNKLDLTKTHSIDSLLNKVGLTQSSSIDSFLQKLYTKSSGIDGILIKPPSVVLNTDDAYNFGIDSTPTLEFTGTDPEGDLIKYQIQIATDINFNDIVIDKNSEDDVGFEIV